MSQGDGVEVGSTPLGHCDDNALQATGCWPVSANGC